MPTLNELWIFPRVETSVRLPHLSVDKSDVRISTFGNQSETSNVCVSLSDYDIRGGNFMVWVASVNSVSLNPSILGPGPSGFSYQD